MTNVDFISNTQDEDQAPLFKSFNWHRKEVEQVQLSGRAYADLAGKVRDITSGCATIMELIEFDNLQDAGSGQRLMNESEKGDLTRLAIQSLRMLNLEADKGLEWAYDYNTKEGKAERAARGKQS